MSLEERLEKAEKLVADVKAELAAMRAEKATKRNWPERIELGMLFKRDGVTFMVGYEDADPASLRRDLVAVYRDPSIVHPSGTNLGGRLHADGMFGPHERECEYLGHARDILTIRTDAHEPTGAELVGVLENIRNVSNNPGRTLTTLGLAECLQSCNVMARKALEGLAK